MLLTDELLTDGTAIRDMIAILNALSKKEVIRLVILISGSGSTMERLLQECQPGGRLWKIQVVGVIASKPSAEGIAKALKFLPTEDVVVVRRKLFASDELFGEAIIDFCRARQADLIGQHGWLPHTPDNVLDAFPTLNQHPGPLRPSGLHIGGHGMYGSRVHFTRLEFARMVGRDWWTEATVHCATPAVDRGPIIMARRIIMKEDDTPDSLQERVLPEERDANVEVYEDICHGNVAEVRDLPRLVRPGEEFLLEEAKRRAILRYP